MPRLPYSLNSYTGGATPGFIAGSGIGSADTVITITGTDSTWATVGSGGGFNLSLQYGSITEEKVYVPTISGIFAGTNTPYATISGFSGGANVIADTYITPSGDKIFLPQQISGNIGVFNTATNTLTTVLSGNNTNLLGLQGAAFSTNNQTYFGGYAAGFVLVYNTTTNAYITILSGSAYGLNGSSQYITTATTSSGNFLYVAGPSNNAVSVINTATNTLATVWSGTSFNFSNLGNMSAINGKMYVSNQGANKVTVVNLNTNTIVTTISGASTGFNNPLSSQTTTVSGVPYVYVWNYSANSISVINSNTDTVTAIISGGTLNTGSNGTQTIMSMQTTTSGSYLFVTNLGGNSVSVFNTATNTLAYTISGTQYNLNAPGGLAITPSGNFAYIANTNTAGNLNVVSLYTISPWLTAPGAITVSGVTRGIDNTTAQVHPSGSSITPVLTAIDLREANSLVNQTIFPASTSSGQSLVSNGTGIVYTPSFTPGKTLNNAILSTPIETINILNTGINGGTTINISSGNTSFYTTPATGNFTVNITANNTLATVMNSGQSVTANLLATQGSTGYALSQTGNNSGISIDGYIIPSGNNYYINTISGTAATSSGLPNCIDIYTFTVLRSNSNYDTLISGLGPDVWFKLNDPLSGSSIYDSSGHGYTGGYVGNIIQQQQGFNPTIPVDTSIYVSNNSYIQTNYVPSWGNAQSFTYNVWIKANYSGARQDFITAGTSTNPLNSSIYIFTTGPGYIEVDNAYAGGPTSSAYVTDGTWHMVTLQATNTSPGNTTYQIYVDGVASGPSQNMNSNFTTPYAMVLGESLGFSQYIGYMSEVSVFKYALSAAQIKSLYQAGTPYTVLSNKVAASGVLLSQGLYNFPVSTSLSFTSAGVSGQNGPSLAQAITGLSSNQSTSWASNTQFFNQGSYNGYQLWTVPATGVYRITASGASGGNCSIYGYYGGSGAVMQGDFSLTQGQQLTILVGQVGTSNIGFSQGGYQAGSGGGTFVALGATASSATALIVAGGGGGAWAWSGAGYYNYGRGGTTSATGSTGGQGNGTAGGTGPSGQAGGQYSGGAAGYSATSPSYGTVPTPAQPFVSGGGGSSEATNWGTYNCWGGFGGGGGGGLSVGGGGGYGPGGSGSWSTYGGGGGGGSYNSGANQVNTNGTDNNSALTGNNRNGSVTIVRLS